MSALLEVRRLVVRLGGRTVLDVEELDLEAGRLGVIVGGAAGGKTTLAAALAGAVPAAGEVRVEGRPLNGPPSRRRRGALSASVRDGKRVSGCTVDEALRLAASDQRRIVSVLERMPQIATRRHLDSGLLSGGEQQLLQVAAAWAANPRVLVLDAPTVGLAADAAATVTALAREHAAAGATVLWLEQDNRAAPGPALGTLVRGRLAPAGESSADAG